MYNSIVISSGHGLHVRGASGILDEVDEARMVTELLGDELHKRGVDVITYHDDVSKSQSENLDRIVDFHNSKTRDLDISVHFNAHQTTSKPMGTEVLYKTQADLAADLSEAIASVGFINRGAKKRPGDAGGSLAFLENTAMPAVLLEVCFVDSEADAELYRANIENIAAAIADVLTDEETVTAPVPPDYQTDDEGEELFHAIGTCSHFGGPDDMGVSASEGLAFHFDLNEANQHLFLPLQPAGTTGLARRLNAKAVSYIACRWDYSVTPKSMLQGPDMALVRAPATGREMTAFPADWGPHEEKTGRAADLSPWLMHALDITTDDTVEVIYPWRGYD